MPADVRQLVPQGAYGSGRIGAFAVTGQQNHDTAGFANIGRLPQGQEGIGSGLQLLLSAWRQLPFQGLGFDLAAFVQGWGGGFGLRGGCLGRGRLRACRSRCGSRRCGSRIIGCGGDTVLALNGQRQGQQKHQAQQGACRTLVAVHHGYPGVGG